jgi:hypothetical protein
MLGEIGPYIARFYAVKSRFLQLAEKCHNYAVQKAVRLLSSVVEQLTCNEQVIRSNRIGGSSYRCEPARSALKQ